MAQTVKRLPTMRETQVRSPGQEDPLEKEMATHSSTVAWKIPWMEGPGKLQSMGLQRVTHESREETHENPESLASVSSVMLGHLCIIFSHLSSSDFKTNKENEREEYILCWCCCC